MCFKFLEGNEWIKAVEKEVGILQNVNCWKMCRVQALEDTTHQILFEKVRQKWGGTGV